MILLQNQKFRTDRKSLPNMLHNHLMLLLFFFFFVNFKIAATNGTTKNINIGVILDMESTVGKTSKICIQRALQDFYQSHNNYTTKIVPLFRDSKHDRVQAAAAAIQLLKDDKVMAIIGPQRSSQADFIVDIGNKAHVPILSMATTPSLAPIENKYFIRVSQNSSSQAQPIADLIKSFAWREVVFIYQDGDFGCGFIPYLSEALLNVGVHIKHRIVISRSASDDVISEELHKLKTNQTRVYVVHLLPKLASRFFKKVNQAGMMQKGYAWIITDVLTSLLHSLNATAKDSMQGVVGVKPNIPRSRDLRNFEKRWKRREDPEIKLDMFGLWSYDATCALAMALERAAANSANYTFDKRNKPPPLTDLDAIGTSKLGPKLLLEIQKTRLKGLSGDFFVVDGQLQSSGYQLVNLLIGNEEKNVSLWTQSKGYNNDIIGGIIWPGGANKAPKGWEIPATKEQNLSIGFPSEGGFVDFIQKGTNESTKPTGFCVDVFEAVMKLVPDSPPYDYKPSNLSGVGSGSYDDLVYGIVQEKYDVVIGDVTIRANRSKYVDFTLPYTESGISMIVLKVDDRKNAWIFMRPLEKKLWLTTFAFFIYTGIVVWVLEHRVNKEFRGRPYKQVGMMFWFSFSTLVFAHKEKMISNLSRFVVIVWIFVVLVLQSSYIASLTSMLTLQQLEPDFTDIYDLMRRGDNVGYKEASYVKEMLKGMGFQNSKLMSYSSLDDYDDALTKGSKNGGVSAIFDELPYVKLFMAKHCNKYIMVGPTYKTAGFGFAFPKGSPLVPLVSKAVLQVTEEELSNISDRWFKQEAYCSTEADMKSGRLSLESFTGLFLIAGLSSTCALIISVFTFLYENREVLLSEASIQEKLSAIAKAFDEEKDKNTTSGPAHVEGGLTEDDVNNSNDNNDDDDDDDQEEEEEEEEEGVIYDDDQGPPGTPIHETTS